MTEGERLAAWGAAVRESTLKRLRKVPAGQENGRMDPDAMSFADLARHVADSDLYLFAVLDGGRPAPVLEGHPGPDRSRGEYEALLAELERLGAERRARLTRLDEAALDRRVHDPRFGETTLWWVIVRGCLDHETHHRGQAAAMLRALAQGAPENRIAPGPPRPPVLPPAQAPAAPTSPP